MHQRKRIRFIFESIRGRGNYNNFIRPHPYVAMKFDTTILDSSNLMCKFVLYYALNVKIWSMIQEAGV